MAVGRVRFNDENHAHRSPRHRPDDGAGTSERFVSVHRGLRGDVACRIIGREPILEQREAMMRHLAMLDRVSLERDRTAIHDPSQRRAERVGEDGLFRCHWQLVHQASDAVESGTYVAGDMTGERRARSLKVHGSVDTGVYNSDGEESLPVSVPLLRTRRRSAAVAAAEL